MFQRMAKSCVKGVVTGITSLAGIATDCSHLVRWFPLAREKNAGMYASVVQRKQTNTHFDISTITALA